MFDFQSLPKPDKKIIHELMEKGLQKEFEMELIEAEKILKEWRNNNKNNKESYHTLYMHIANFDKHIARRYDGMTGSRYIQLVSTQLEEELISEEDIAGLSEKGKGYLKFKWI